MFEHYLQYEYPLAQIQLVLFMLGMGAALTVSDFFPVFRQPKDLLIGLSYQLILMALVAFAFTNIAGLPAGIAIGLILVAALPGGTLSNVLTYISRGNAALSISLSGSAALLSMATIPIVLRLLAAEYIPEGFQLPVLAVVQEIVLCLLLPLCAGMVLARLAPAWKSPFSKWCIGIGFFFVVVMVVGSLGSGRVRPEAYGWQIHLAIVFFCVLMQQLSMLPHRLLRGRTENYVAMGLEVTVRNIYLGIMLASLLFPAQSGDPLGGDVMFVVLAYGAVMVFAGFPLAFRIRRVLRRRQGTIETSASSDIVTTKQLEHLRSGNDG